MNIFAWQTLIRHSMTEKAEVNFEKLEKAASNLAWPFFFFPADILM